MFEKAIEKHIIICLLKITYNTLCLLKTTLYIHTWTYDVMSSGVIMSPPKLIGYLLPPFQWQAFETSFQIVGQGSPRGPQNNVFSFNTRSLSLSLALTDLLLVITFLFWTSRCGDYRCIPPKQSSVLFWCKGCGSQHLASLRNRKV